MVEVRVVGGLTAAVDGKAVALPADARARELLGWLAVHPGQHGRSTVAGVLRPDVAEEHARKTLRTAIYELRRTFGEADVLTPTREHVTLAPGVHVDLVEFERLRAAGELERAAAVGAGPLLAGMDADWILRAREIHAAAVARVLARLAALAEREGDLGAAVAWARRRAESDPLSEEAHRELVRLLAVAGDRPAALNSAGAFAERLRRELGVAPSAPTRALAEDVRRGRVGPARRPAEQVPLPEALARTVRPVGRDAELDRLLGAWHEASDGLRVAAILGEAGMGKTTLAGALARRAHADGATVLHGRCDEEAMLAHQCFAEAIARHLDASGPEERDAWLAARGGALGRLLPGVAAESDPAGDEQAARWLAFEAVRAGFERAAANHGAVLVLDDVQWADPGAVRLLRHLVRTMAGVRLLIVLTVRTGEAGDGGLGALHRETPVLRVALAGLDDAAAGALVAASTGTQDGALARALRERTGGNPFFMVELLRDGADTARAPAAVADVVAGRIARLGPDTSLVLELAALAGSPFGVRALAMAGRREPATVLAALEAAAAAGLISGTSDPGRYVFAHALVAEAVLARIGTARRAQLHLALADALESQAPPAEVARHLRAARPLSDPRRHVAWELRAAAAATASLAHEESARHHQCALDAGAPGTDRAAVLLGLGHAHARAGNPAGARAAFEQAAVLARERGDVELFAEAALGFGGLGVVIAQPDPAVVALLEEALAEASPAAAARLRSRLAVELYYADLARAQELSAAAVAGARSAQDPKTLTAALNARRVALWEPGRLAERFAATRELHAAAVAAGDREAALQARNWQVVDLLEAGRRDELDREVEAYAAAAEDLGLPHYRWYAALWRGTLALLDGRWSDVEPAAVEALRLGRQAADANAERHVRILRAAVLDSLGRWGEMDRNWFAQQARDPHRGDMWCGVCFQVDLALGRIEPVRAGLRRIAAGGFAAVRMDANWHVPSDFVDAVEATGDLEAAALLYERLAPHAGSFLVVARGAASAGSADAYVGRLAAVLGRLEEAEARLRAAAERNAALGAPALEARARWHLGSVLLRRGDATGNDERARARATAGSLGIVAFAAHPMAAADGAGAATGSPLPLSSPTP